ncbi:MAG: Asp-tRNA(Asn)/Glu-tRNA(Gln) amidotransferase subunit GatC [Alphaproteobacteria bacterium]|nr:Asp-tRNA(Asn)/Glu-tRNA(Gln) amidotransferase subunit GatC [Alphaproteobacteria bacterium]
MSIDHATVRRIARLARIHVPDDDVERLGAELSQILGFVEQLGEVDVDGVEPITSVVDAVLALREDRVSDGGDAERVLSNAPDRVDDFYVVPRVVE